MLEANEHKLVTKMTVNGDLGDIQKSSSRHSPVQTYVIGTSFEFAVSVVIPP